MLVPPDADDGRLLARLLRTVSDVTWASVCNVLAEELKLTIPSHVPFSMVFRI
jgi:hypothetical protein